MDEQWSHGGYVPQRDIMDPAAYPQAAAGYPQAAAAYPQAAAYPRVAAYQQVAAPVAAFPPVAAYQPSGGYTRPAAYHPSGGYPRPDGFPIDFLSQEGTSTVAVRAGSPPLRLSALDLNAEASQYLMPAVHQGGLPLQLYNDHTLHSQPTQSAMTAGLGANIDSDRVRVLPHSWMAANGATHGMHARAGGAASHWRDDEEAEADGDESAVTNQFLILSLPMIMMWC